jgi:cell division protease FtsH
MTPRRRRALRWGAVVVVIVAGSVAFALTSDHGPKREDLALSALEHAIAARQVREATIIDGAGEVEGVLASGQHFSTTLDRGFVPTVVGQLVRQGALVRARRQTEPLVLRILSGLVPIVAVFLAFAVIVNLTAGRRRRGRHQGGWSRAGGRRSRPGPSLGVAVPGSVPLATFDDVAGVADVVAELAEIRDFLADPGRFLAMGATLPRGVLLYGPPGTGKTLLARAVAGEAGVPFLSISGSDFVELFVGLGASRVRELFEEAKAEAPAIVFIDEIDAVGRERGSVAGSGHDEREQTLNQLLVEMDGFDRSSAVLVIAATNRPDVLDPALLRPGRFDRRIGLDLPDFAGRLEILRLHARSKPLAPDVELEATARRTAGFTGADLANVLNEAALLAARRRDTLVRAGDVDEAVVRVVAGPERGGTPMGEKERRLVAFHEAGHAVLAAALTGEVPSKVSIVARGRSLGFTWASPRPERRLVTRAELMDRLAVLLAGRAAVELAFGELTSGAEDDIAEATALARAMVTELGMSEKLGPLWLGGEPRSGVPGAAGSVGAGVERSEVLASRIDAEIYAVVDAAHRRATAVLDANAATLERVAEALLVEETLDARRLTQIVGHLRAEPAPPVPSPALPQPPEAAHTEGTPGAHLAGSSVQNLPPWTWKPTG